MTAAVLLDRLERIKQTGPGRWIAACPAHDDRSPSLSIRELDDGRVLLHDFGGCDTEAVLSALGLSMSDLFREPLPGRGEAQGYTPTRSRIPARDLLEIIDHEVLVAVLVIDDVLATGTVTEEQRGRLTKAAARIGRARDHGR